jgi:alkanesulfonate monooxygenase SsuD/methylene tetrahydromethanopterin reductase-like flavin-dependent oxidoreductase (luciferase family)
MGIGAGWYEHEWRAFGYGFPAARDRLGMLDEGVQIMRQAWSEGSATLDGKYYQVDGAIVRPLPLQDGGIPLWIAGGGEKVTLKIAAKYAQYTNFDGTLDTFTRKSELLRGHCETVGTDFDAIVRSSNFNVVTGSTEAEVSDRLAAIRSRMEPFVKSDRLDGFMQMLSSTSGTPEQIAEKLSAVAAAGLGYAIINFPDAAYDRAGIELFEREVIPALA